MKRFSSLSLLIVLLLSLLPGCANDTAKGAVLYIAPNGSDKNNGTKSSPLATVAGARDRIREIKDASGLPEGGVTVYIRGGAYRITETVHFGEADSGDVSAPVSYTAYPGETPVFTGGSYIKGRDFTNVADAGTLARLSPEAREKVLCCDLFKNGVKFSDLDYSKDYWRAGNLREHESEEYRDNRYFVPRMQVFIDDDALYLARYPNKSEGIFEENPYNQYLRIPDVIETGFDPVTEQPNGRQCAFKTYEDRIKGWQTRDDVIIFGMTGWEFFQTEAVADKIDPEAMTVTLRATPTSGVQGGSRYAFANVLEELDRPGEYYIDRAGTLYLYPTKDMRDATVKLSLFDGNYVINSQDASFLTFSGLTFELTKGSIFWINGGKSCTVENCTLKNYGIDGVRLGEWVLNTSNYADVYGTGEFQRYLDERSAAVNGINHRISGCTFLNTGCCAALINSGHTGYRESGGAVFENNTVKHSGLIGSCYFSGLVLNGCGITVKNNSFLFCRGQAINGSAIDTEIIYNEFCDSPCDMAEDTGTIYLNYQGQNDGVKIRHNYFHDVTSRGYGNVYAAGFDFARRGAAGYDNAQPFHDFSYNVVYNVPCVCSNPMSPISPSTTINNVFIDCDYVLDYPDEFIRDWYHGESGSEIVKTENTLPKYYLNGMYKDRLWREKYPEHYEYYKYMESEKTDMRPVMAQVYNNIIVYLEGRMSGRATELPEEVAVDTKYGRVENNHFLYGDPGFADAAKYDFQLSESAAAEYGVERLDMSAVGAPGLIRPRRLSELYKDPLRAVPAAKNINVEVPGGRQLVIVSLWRLAAPGVWVWQFDSPIVGDQAAWFPARPGGTYTAYFHGDNAHYPQFMGGLAGETPPEGVETFAVGPDQDSWDYFKFELRRR